MQLTYINPLNKKKEFIPAGTMVQCFFKSKYEELTPWFIRLLTVGNNGEINIHSISKLFVTTPMKHQGDKFFLENALYYQTKEIVNIEKQCEIECQIVNSPITDKEFIEQHQIKEYIYDSVIGYAAQNIDEADEAKEDNRIMCRLS